MLSLCFTDKPRVWATLHGIYVYVIPLFYCQTTSLSHLARHLSVCYPFVLLTNHEFEPPCTVSKCMLSLCFTAKPRVWATLHGIWVYVIPLLYWQTTSLSHVAWHLSVCYPFVLLPNHEFEPPCTASKCMLSLCFTDKPRVWATLHGILVYVIPLFYCLMFVFLMFVFLV